MAEPITEVQLPQALVDAIAKTDANLEVNKGMEAMPKKDDEKDEAEKAMSEEECEKAFADLEKALKDAEDEKCKAMPASFKDFIAKKRGSKKEAEKALVIPDLAKATETSMANMLHEIKKSNEELIAAVLKSEKTESVKALEAQVGKLEEVVKAIGDAPRPRMTVEGRDTGEAVKELEGMRFDFTPVKKWARSEKGISDFQRIRELDLTLDNGGIAGLAAAAAKYGIPESVLNQIGAVK